MDYATHYNKRNIPNTCSYLNMESTKSNAMIEMNYWRWKIKQIICYCIRVNTQTEKSLLKATFHFWNAIKKWMKDLQNFRLLKVSEKVYVWERDNPCLIILMKHQLSENAESQNMQPILSDKMANSLNSKTAEIVLLHMTVPNEFNLNNRI